MFEFAISQNRKPKPTQRFLLSCATSFLIHLCVLLILIENPNLFGHGLSPWLRHLAQIAHISVPQKESEPEWRTVTVLRGSGPMREPSMATLKKFIYHWDKKGEGEGTPPVTVRWGNEPESASAKPAPIVKQVTGMQEPKPVPPVAESKNQGVPEGSGAANVAPPVDVAQNSSGSKKGSIYLPAPAPEPKPAPPKPPETANTAPSSIPKAPTPTPPQTKEPARVFENEQQAIHGEGTGLFDTKGFPLGDYASVIIERIKGNWSIPSNLRNSQGRTTVIFFIEKDGRFSDAKIVTSSGNSSLDLAALNAVIGSNPFPALPKGFPGEHVGAKFVFSYNERQ